MTNEESVALLQRWRDHGDEAAVAELFGRYYRRLVALANSRLWPALARRVDGSDIVQSACNSLFVRVRDGRIQVAPGDDLWQLLVTITLRKLVRQIEFHTAAKRSIRQEQEAVADDSIHIPVEAVARSHRRRGRGRQ